MFCPQCEAEYREGIVECADCGVRLVEAPPPEPEHPEPDYVEVFETSDPAELPVVISMLQSAGIEPLVQGDEVMGVLPVGQFGGAPWSDGGHGLNVLVLVAREHADEARALLSEVAEGEVDDPE